MQIDLLLENGQRFALTSGPYIRYVMKYGVREDVLACRCEPDFVLEAEYSPTKTEVRTAFVGLCSRQGRGPLFDGREVEHVNVVMLTGSSQFEVGEVEEGPSAIFAALGIATRTGR